MDDSVDRAILTAISRDGRATLSQLLGRRRPVGLCGAVAPAPTGDEGCHLRISGDPRPRAGGTPLSAFIEITPLDPAQPEQRPPSWLEHLDAIEACHSIAGDASYMLFVRVPSPRALEELVRDVRLAANVSTRTTVVLQTYYEHRPIIPVGSAE